MLDLGATAKALAADRAAAAAAGAVARAYWWRSAATSPSAGAAPADGWTVRVTDDHRDTSGPGSA